MACGGWANSDYRLGISNILGGNRLCRSRFLGGNAMTVADWALVILIGIAGGLFNLWLLAVISK